MLSENSKPDSEDVHIRVLLVDDQPIIAAAVRKMVENEPDIEFFYCQNPLEALSKAAEIKPTVILQDLVMPDVDGLTLVKYFRANPATRDLPLIVLSSNEDAQTKFKAFENGANDYMVKFPHKLEVLARLRYHSAGYIHLLERDRAMAELKKSRDALKNELEQAAQYVESLLPAKIDTPEIRADWIFKSSTELGGDCFGYGNIDAENFAMYLIDVCGHGVGAALLSVSAMNVLRSQSLAGVDFRHPLQVLDALNSAFLMERQNNMFFTIWYGVYNIRQRKIRYASGGHPPAILISGGESSELTTRGMVVGGIEGTRYKEAVAAVPKNSKLYIFSDGVYEIDDAKTGGVMSFSEFRDKLGQPISTGESKIAQMFEYAAKKQNSTQFQDDYSMCEITFK